MNFIIVKNEISCRSFGGLHLLDKFDTFTINIEYFIGKSSEESPQITPTFPIKKSRPPDIDFVIPLESYTILTLVKSIETTLISSTK